MLVTSGEKRDLEVKRSGDNPEETEQNPAAGPASSQPVSEKGNEAGMGKAPAASYSNSARSPSD